MKIVKLDAINSTNTFLKEMIANDDVENFTVVIASEQTNGRGQMNATWQSDKGKNLLFSVLIKFDDFQIHNQFSISKVISLAVYDVLSSLISSPIYIKWPNDIMAENKKICGILIENSVKKANIYQSVVGIGLNVNQQVFNNLPNATSLKLLTAKKYDLDKLLENLIVSIKKYVALLNTQKFNIIDDLYLQQLYKINKPAMFKDDSGTVFMGIIIGVSQQGILRVKMENETVIEYNLKEISFVY